MWPRDKRTKDAADALRIVDISKLNSECDCVELSGLSPD